MKSQKSKSRLVLVCALAAMIMALRLLMADNDCMPSDFRCTGVFVVLGNATWGQSDCPPSSTDSPNPNDIPMMCHKCDSVTGTAGGSGILASWGSDSTHPCLLLETGVCAEVSIDLGGTGCDFTNNNGALVFSNPQHSGTIQVKATLHATCYTCPDETITNECTQCSFPTESWETSGTIEVDLPPDEEDGGDCGGSGCSNTGSGSGSGTSSSCSSCGSGDDRQFGTGCTMNDSVNFRLNLGRSTPKKNAGYISLYSLGTSAALSTPAALQLPFNRPGVTMIPDGTGHIRQVLVPQGLVNVVTVSAYEYHLECYYSSQVGSIGTDGFYTTSGSPFTTWIVKNPDGATSTDRLWITEQRDTSRTFQYTHTSTDCQWDLLKPDGQTTVRTYKIVDTSDSTITNYVRELYSGSTLISKRQKTDKYDSSLQRRLPLTDVEGDSTTTRTTTYTYPSGGNLVQRIDYPEGNWVYYKYDEFGRATNEFSAFGNSAPPTAGSEPDPIASVC